MIAYSLDAEWIPLSTLISNGSIALKRGLVIPKKEKSVINRYPVYSSSVVNDGLMGYNDTYMFEDELVSWSIDGGGNFFYRHPHKFNITNVSGVILADKAIWNYRFIAEMLSFQHSKQTFDYQSKAHPSVICDLYFLPMINLDEQTHYARIFEAIDERLSIQTSFQENAQKMKTYLIGQMFI